MYLGQGNIETITVGIHEFRENLERYLEKGRPLAITRHGETLGFFVPAKTAHRPAELNALRAAANDLDAMIESWGSTEESLLKEYNEIRRTAREKNRED